MIKFSDPNIGLHFGLRQRDMTGCKVVIEKVFEENDEVSLSRQDYANLVYIVNMTRIVPLRPFGGIELVDETRENVPFKFNAQCHDRTRDGKCE